MHSAARIWAFRTGMPTADLAGYSVEAIDGEIGNVDEATHGNGTSYVVVDTGTSMSGTKVVLPAGLITDIDNASERILVDRTRAEIANAPEFDEHRYRDHAYRTRLGGYYGYRDAAVYHKQPFREPSEDFQSSNREEPPMKQQELSRVRLDEMRGAPVYDSAGDKIGKVDEIFYDQQTRVPEWIGIGTGFFGTKRVLVPVEGAQVTKDGLMVRYSKDQVKDSPDVDEDEISQEQEAELASFYGMGYSERRSDTGLPEGHGRQSRRMRDEDQAVTRSEEELQVGKRSEQAGTARLRKWVETEPVALDVKLNREVARVTRERIDQPVGEHDFSEQEVEVPLRQEKPVVQKQAVAKERIRLEKDIETERQTVQDELKKERVEVEGDVKRRDR